jgi:hypothetical protein
MPTYEVTWARQGTVRWEKWWLDERGPWRTHIPGFEEHVGFANFDLGRNGLPELRVTANGALAIDLDSQHQLNELRENAAEILNWHGFKLGEPL